MKVAYWALHYGAEYLAWSIRSVQDAVDELHVLYTPHPSFGHGTDLVCPDSEDDLKREADRFRAKPLFWHRGAWPNEGAHRDEIMKIARQRGTDQILVVDADEVWDPGSAAEALEESAARPERILRARFAHFWRSLKWVCLDGMNPARLIKPSGSGESSLERQPKPVFHFGYAQSLKIVEYKQSIHGHKSEWRPGWFEQKYAGWRPGIDDVHPTCVGIWNPRLPDEALSRVLEPQMSDHPYWGLDLIP